MIKQTMYVTRDGLGHCVQHVNQNENRVLLCRLAASLKIPSYTQRWIPPLVKISTDHR